MRIPRKYTILLIALTMAATTLVCSSGYVTPASLTATANAPLLVTSFPTAYFVAPSETPTMPPTPSTTPDPALASASPNAASPTPDLSSPTPTEGPLDANAPPIQYMSQSGDTREALAARFGVHPLEIVPQEAVPEEGLIEAGQLLLIPQRLANTSSPERILPDSEVVYSPSALDFDIKTYVGTLGAYLSSYREYLGSTGWTTGADIIARVAIENSINPRLLLSLLEYQGGWVLGQPRSLSQTDYPLGYINIDDKGLYDQLVWAVNQLSQGYYRWRDGSLTTLSFRDGTTLRLAPELNAGSVALAYYFSQVTNYEGWLAAMEAQNGLAKLHATMFGDPWLRASAYEPLFPSGLAQPEMILPFLIGQRWALTGGPHGAWEGSGSQAALDFAPASTEPGCVKSDQWVVAAAPGLVVRTSSGVAVIDLDGDGNEQTGWALVYLHLSHNGKLPVGKWVDQSEMLGNPSCEGGRATGTHVHIARKYNGEWIAADGPIPFVLSGWQAHAGEQPYQGYLTRDDATVPASLVGAFESTIVRQRDEPQP